MRHALPIAAVLVLANSAAALPEIYVGVGGTSLGVPGGSERRLGAGAELGVDDLFSSFGVGAALEADFQDFNLNPSAELRYSIIKIPFIRLLAGASVGMDGFAAKASGAFGAFIGARVSLGLPYVGARLGVRYSTGATTEATKVGGMLTIGLAL